MGNVNQVNLVGNLGRDAELRYTPELRRGRAEGVGRLERMAPLHAPPAALALPNVDLKFADRRQRRVVVFIDPERRTPTRLRPIGPSGFPSRSLRIRLQRLRKRRRLEEAGAARRIQLAFQPIDLLAQPLILPAQRLSLALGVLRPFAPRLGVARIRRRLDGRLRIRHATFMADSRKKYKYGNSSGRKVAPRPGGRTR